MPSPLFRALAPLAALLPAACASYAPASDTTVVVHSRGGDELGVATDLGIVFTGSGQRSGTVEYTVFFGDDPSRERGEIEPLTTELLALDPELRLASTAIGFPELGDGDRVRVRGRDGRRRWQRSARVATNPAADGLLLRTSGLASLDADDVGAGVYADTPEGEVLVGLVRGRVWLPSGEGQQEYVAVAGARELVGLGLRGRSVVPDRVPRDRHDALR